MAKKSKSGGLVIMPGRFCINGKLVDDESRCIHYHSSLDIVAIKFYCCKEYYSCYYCHQEKENHPVKRWPQASFSEKAILCGKCKKELTIQQYLSVTACPCCKALFNPGCSIHYPLYFVM